VRELRQRKRVPVIASLEAKGGETSISPPFSHRGENCLLDCVVGTSECDVRQTCRRHRIQSVACPIAKVTVDMSSCIQVGINDVAVEARCACHFVEGFVVVSKGQSFSAAEIKQNVAVHIDDVVPSRLEMVDQRKHF